MSQEPDQEPIVLHIQKEGPVAILTIDDARTRNALSPP